MIILTKDCYHSETSLEELVQIDKKANIMECFRLINMEVSSRYPKAELAEIYDIFFHKDTGWILNKIPKEEWPILFTLLHKKRKNMWSIHGTTVHSCSCRSAIW